MSKKKTILIVLGIILLIIGIMSFFFISKVIEGNKILAETTYTAVDISSVADGVYRGEFEAGMVYAEVEITVKDGGISIQIMEHRNGLGSSAESIIIDMHIWQTTDVDFISGATISSKVIRKAIENALTN